jgi:hypothetical protein
MRKRKKTKDSKKQGKEILAQTYDESWKAADRIVELTNTFCLNHLNEDYRELCEDMIASLLDIGLPLEKGKPAGWASGIVYALGRVNFLQDPSQSPHTTSAQIAEGFGVSQATMMAKAGIIRDKLDLIRLDPAWCIPVMLEHNPLVWMLKVNGVIMDIRTAPREAQEEAYRLGLIPCIPADKQEPKPQPDSQAKIVQFPAGQNDTPRPESARKPKDVGPTLFKELEK